MTFWCVVHTHAQSENKAAFNLRRQGYTVFLPKHLKRRKHARRIDWVPSPLFPRYLFVRLHPETTPWRAILSTVGVCNLISIGDRPAAVPGEIITEIRARLDDKSLVKTHSGCAFNRGDRVHVVNGPLSDFEGLFECTDGEERVTILLDLMGRRVKVRAPLETVYACA